MYLRTCVPMRTLLGHRCPSIRRYLSPRTKVRDGGGSFLSVCPSQRPPPNPPAGAMSPLAAARKYEYTFQKSPRRVGWYTKCQKTQDTDDERISNIFVSFLQDLQTINSVLRSTRSEGTGPKRNLMASLMASPQPLECGLPAAKRMALPPIGLSLPSTSQEHMSAIISNIQVGSHPLLSPTSKQLQGPPL